MAKLQKYCKRGHLLEETRSINSWDGRYRCKKCTTIRQKLYARRKGKKFIRNQNLIQKYGITLDEWNVLLDSQNGTCAICKSKDPKDIRGWHTDHCHSTGVVRGILCRDCNIGLGHYQIMKTMQDVVEKYIGGTPSQN